MRVCFIHLSGAPKSARHDGSNWWIPVHFSWLLVDTDESPSVVIGGEASTEAMVETPRSAMKASVASSISLKVSELSDLTVSTGDLEEWRPMDW